MTSSTNRIAPADVRSQLSRHILDDGFPLVMDLARSRGSRVFDAVSGQEFLDFYTFFASSPLGINPPDIVDDPDFMAELARIAVNKPANGDVYTPYYAEFIDTFTRVLGDPALPHFFVIEGGGAAVENALKVAFDWKSRHNEMHGRSPQLGTKAMHLTHAFHGRGGYSLSLTNTDPVKTARFPKFDWPRIDAPVIRFPLADNLAEVKAAEEKALRQAQQAFDQYPHDIACFIAEPIQGEGGDNHMRAEFLQAMQQLCRDNDALFVLDEVQTGCGLTGTAWAYQQLGLEPDVVAFAKKVQVGGIMAGRRVDEVPDNVFEVSSRIDSTWNGNLADMVRSRRLLEVIERDGLISRAAVLGERLLGLLQQLEVDHSTLVSNVRGRGLMCAFDLPDQAIRAESLRLLLEDERVLLMPCGERSIRLRPHLAVREDELVAVTAAFDRVLAKVSSLDASTQLPLS